MSRKIISTFTAAAMSMSIALAVPVAVTAVSSVTVVSEAHAGWGSKLKRVTKRKLRKAKNGFRTACPSVGICGGSIDIYGASKNFMKKRRGRIGDPVRGTK
jgi:hypothetical protein